MKKCHINVIYRIDTVKVEDILLMVQNYDKIKFFDISDILRIYLIRYYIQKRTYTDITVPFLKIYKHQVNIIRGVFENKDIKPLEVTFLLRNYSDLPRFSRLLPKGTLHKAIKSRSSKILN